MKVSKTNAMRLLDAAGILYETHSYRTDDGALDGVSVARKTGRDPAQVFKTLVAQDTLSGLLVFCIPVAQELNLKQAAHTAEKKSISMLPQARLLSETGYIHGGVSPVGMKRLLPTFLCAAARQQNSILVSGGKVGLQIELSPKDLLAICRAQWMEMPPATEPSF